MASDERLSFWEELAGYPLFVLRLFIHPRSLVRGMDYSDARVLRRLTLYALISLTIIVLAFSDNAIRAGEAKPLLDSFKGVVMRAHLSSWELKNDGKWPISLEPIYAPLHISQGEAMRLWDTLLSTGFLIYTMFAALIGVSVVARIRMKLFGLSWQHAIGTGLLGLMPAAACIALSLVPLFELILCRECIVRSVLFVLLNLMGWAYMGYYALGDFGERPGSAVRVLLKSLGYGAALYLACYFVFFVLICAIIPV